MPAIMLRKTLDECCVKHRDTVVFCFLLVLSYLIPPIIPTKGPTNGLSPMCMLRAICLLKGQLQTRQSWLFGNQSLDFGLVQQPALAEFFWGHSVSDSSKVKDLKTIWVSKSWLISIAKASYSYLDICQIAALYSGNASSLVKLDLPHPTQIR